MDSTTDDERDASVCTFTHPLSPTPAVASASSDPCEASPAHVDPNDPSTFLSSSFSASRSTESTTVAPAADLRTPLPFTVHAPPFSDLYAFITRRWNSLLGLFNSGTNSTSGETQGVKTKTSRCAASSPSFSNANPSCRAGQETRSAPRTKAAAAAAGGGAARGERRPLVDFLTYLALPGLHSEADSVLEHHAALLGLETAIENSGASFNSDSVSASADDRAPSTFTSAATATAATESPAKPDHVHHLRATQFFVPTLCEVCRRAVLDTKVWPSPSALSQKAANGGTPSTSAASLSFFSRFLLSLMSAPSLQTPSPSSSPGGGRTETTDAMATTTTTTTTTAAAAASRVQQPLLGFGSDGYHCEMCDVALHRHCLHKLRKTQRCVVLTPAAHEIPEDIPTTADKATKPGKSDAAASASNFSLDGVKSLLGSYLDPNGGANSRKDANVKVVLSGVFAWLDIVAQRYPDLSPLTFLKRRQAIQDLSLAHQTLYAACTASLADTKLLQAISWEAIEQRDMERTACRRGGLSGAGEANDEEGVSGIAGLVGVSLLTREMHPVKMDASLFSHLTASFSGTASSSVTDVKNYLPSFAQSAPGEVTGPGASFPVQLLLWRALRYAMAVYGEVYRRGSLSSTVSAALLFTVNRGGVDVAKEANDKAVTSLLELPPSSLRLSRWAAQTTEPSYVLLVDHAVGQIVVSFRGTLNTFDIMTDLAAVGVPFCRGYAHQGAAHVVNSMFDHRSSQYAGRKQRRPDRCVAKTGGVEVKEKSDDCGNAKVVLEPYAMQALEKPDGLLDGLEQLAADYPTYSILITGHSLGGAVAVLFATRLHHDGVFSDAVLRRIHVIAFAPMPSLSLPAASCFDAVSCDRADGGFGHSTAGVAADARARKTAQASSSLHKPPTPSPPQQQHQQQQHRSPPLNASATAAAAPTAAFMEKGEVPESEVRQAVFPVWNVVNGFDCVPRLQVNTVDRLLRQVVGTQIAASTPTAAGARRRGNREGREDSAPGEEMMEMPAGVDAPAAPATEAVASPAATEQHCEVDTASAAEVSAAGKDARGVALEAIADESINTTASTTAATTAHPTEEAEVVVVRRQAATLQTTTEKTKEAPASSLTASVAAAGVKTIPKASSSAAAGKTSRNDGDLSHELHHPGRVLLLTSPRETMQNRLVDVPRGHPVMHELFLMKLMLVQHAVDAYGGALTEIRSQ